VYLVPVVASGSVAPLTGTRRLRATPLRAVAASPTAGRARRMIRTKWGTSTS